MIKKTIPDLDLAQTAYSGQVFRMLPVEEERAREISTKISFPEDSPCFRAVTGCHQVEICQNGHEFAFMTSESEFELVWRDYFDLDTDYSEIKKLCDPADTYLLASIKKGWGIRILKQDLWEVIVSFVISQNNNIPRIRASIEKLCSLTGNDTIPDPEFFSLFPVNVLHSFGLGYRDEYLHKIAVNVMEGTFMPGRLRSMSYEDAKKELMKQTGIGNKVADCICVFGLHMLNAFPIDTHVKKILSEHYKDGFPFDKYGKYAAVLQQYMFYNDLTK